MQETESKDAGSELLGDSGIARLGNAGLRKDVEEARRIYDPAVEKEWMLKYRNFSSDHMRIREGKPSIAYKAFAEARHDPFNKVPNWVDVVVKNIGKKFMTQGVTPEEEFAKVDVSGDGVLSRTEVRKMLLQVVPTLGDMELATIIDVLDEDHSGVISLGEFTRQIFGREPGRKYSAQKSRNSQDLSTPRREQSTARSSKQSSQADSRGDAGESNDQLSLHRTPVHRIHRIGPAQIEGWDHLRKNPEHKGEGPLLKARDQDMFKRIGADLCLSPRPAPKVPGATPKYTNFGGGGDTERFRSLQWRKDLQESGGSLASMSATSVPDPGGLEIKPGYHVTLGEKCPHFVSPRRSPRQ